MKKRMGTMGTLDLPKTKATLIIAKYKTRPRLLDFFIEGSSSMREAKRGVNMALKGESPTPIKRALGTSNGLYK